MQYVIITITHEGIVMEPGRLQHLSQRDLACLLKTLERGTPQWYAVRDECRRRMDRWSQLANHAGFFILACLFIISVVILAG